MSQLDETIPGGLYLDAQGVYRDAWGNKVEPPSGAAQPETLEPEIKKPADDKKKKSKEVTDE